MYVTSKKDPNISSFYPMVRFLNLYYHLVNSSCSVALTFCVVALKHHFMLMRAQLAFDNEIILAVCIVKRKVEIFGSDIGNMLKTILSLSIISG